MTISRTPASVSFLMFSLRRHLPRELINVLLELCIYMTPQSRETVDNLVIHKEFQSLSNKGISLLLMEGGGGVVTTHSLEFPCKTSDAYMIVMIVEKVYLTSLFHCNTNL